MNKKQIIFIILGLGFIVLLTTYGIKIYYQQEDMYRSYTQKINEIMEPAKKESESCFAREIDSGYRLCCAITGGIKKGLFYDCTSQKYFEPNQLIRVIFDPSKFDFDYDFYYLVIHSDLYDEEGSQIHQLFPELLIKQTPNKMVINGRVPQDKELFTLLKLNVYPDVPVFEEGDEKTILNLQAQISKE